MLVAAGEKIADINTKSPPESKLPKTAPSPTSPKCGIIAPMHLGLDIGTSAVKAVLSDGRARIFATAAAPLPSPSRPQPGWSEQNPEDWWEASRVCLAQLRAAAPRRFSASRVLGLSGQMHGVAALDERDRPLRPAILWDDSRAARECRLLEKRVPDLARIAGVSAMPGLSAPKILWLEKHEPKLRRRIRHVLLPKDYVRLKLTGERRTDRSDAAGTLWLDQARRDWSDEILSACGLTRAEAPGLAEGPEVCGKILPAMAAALGAPRGLAVVGGAGDCAAAAISAGAVAEGAACLSLGTAGVYVVAASAHRPAPGTGVHAFCHALPNLWMRMSAMLNGAGCLEWAAGVLGIDAAEADRLAADADADGSVGSAGRAMFLPYLRGERTPHNDPSARGAMVGMGPGFGRGDFVRAVMEGAAMSMALGRDLLRHAGANPAPPIVSGGGAQSRTWMQMLADFLDEPVRTGEAGRVGSALGAARLARLSEGESVAEVCPPPPIAGEFFPRPHRRAECAALRARFDKLYPALRPAFRAAAKAVGSGGVVGSGGADGADGMGGRAE